MQGPASEQGPRKGLPTRGLAAALRKWGGRAPGGPFVPMGSAPRTVLSRLGAL